MALPASAGGLAQAAWLHITRKRFFRSRLYVQESAEGEQQQIELTYFAAVLSRAIKLVTRLVCR